MGDKRAGRPFRPGWSATVGAIALIGLTLGLAIWQLERAGEKRALQDGYIASQGGLPRSAEDLEVGPGDHFARVRLEGTYDADRQFLVDNRTLNGRPGYLVLTPLVDRRGRRFLVTRGWLPAADSRRELPEIPTREGQVSAEAVVWPDTGLLPLLADDPWTDAWPKRVQRLNMARLGAAADIDYPYVLRLEVGQPGMLEALPNVVEFRPERHEGYALQWFALGALVAVLWVVIGMRRGL